MKFMTFETALDGESDSAANQYFSLESSPFQPFRIECFQQYLKEVPPKTNMTIKHPPFEDVFPIGNGDLFFVMLVFRSVPAFIN